MLGKTVQEEFPLANRSVKPLPQPLVMNTDPDLQTGAGAAG